MFEPMQSSFNPTPVQPLLPEFPFVQVPHGVFEYRFYVGGRIFEKRRDSVFVEVRLDDVPERLHYIQKLLPASAAVMPKFDRSGTRTIKSMRIQKNRSLH